MRQRLRRHAWPQRNRREEMPAEWAGGVRSAGRQTALALAWRISGDVCSVSPKDSKALVMRGRVRVSALFRSGNAASRTPWLSRDDACSSAALAALAPREQRQLKLTDFDLANCGGSLASPRNTAARALSQASRCSSCRLLPETGVRLVARRRRLLLNLCHDNAQRSMRIRPNKSPRTSWVVGARSVAARRAGRLCSTTRLQQHSQKDSAQSRNSLPSLPFAKGVCFRAESKKRGARPLLRWGPGRRSLRREIAARRR